MSVRYVRPLTEQQRALLESTRKNDASHRARMRAHGLLLSSEGITIKAIAKIYHVDRDTVATWIKKWEKQGDCSKDTGFIQPVHDGVRRGLVDDLRLGLHATYPGQDAHGSALACAPGRPAFASCGSVGCPAPPHARWTAAVCRRETSALSPGSGKRAS